MTKDKKRESAAVPWTPSRGAEYLTGKGLDWERVDAEYELAASPQELLGGRVAAEAIRKGATTSVAAGMARAAVAAAFPELAGQDRPVDEDDEDDEDAA